MLAFHAGFFVWVSGLCGHASGFSRQLQVYCVIKGDHATVPVDRPLNFIKELGPDGILYRNMVRIGAKQRNIFLGGKIPCSMKQGIANIGKAVFFRNHRPAAGFITPIFFRRLLLGLIKLVIVFPIKRFNFLCQGRPAFIAKRVIGKPRESAAALSIA